MIRVSRRVIGLILALVSAMVAAMFAVGKDNYLESDGKAVNVDLLYTVEANQLIVADSWAGITGRSGDSGDTIAMEVAQREWQMEVPSGLDVAVGAIVWLEIADVTGHTPDDTAYTTSAGAGKIPLLKATSAKDGNNVVTGILFPTGQVVT